MCHCPGQEQCAHISRPRPVFICVQAWAKVQMFLRPSLVCTCAQTQASVHMCFYQGQCAHVSTPNPVCTCGQGQCVHVPRPRPVCTCVFTKASVHMCPTKASMHFWPDPGSCGHVSRPRPVCTCIRTQASMYMWPGQCAYGQTQASVHKVTL